MRIDIYLYQFGYTKSRQVAKTLIDGLKVKIDGQVIKKPSFDIDENIEHSVKISEQMKYVGRGGEKLETALDCFDISVKDKLCIDIGASSGGFTDCLLQRGAKEVYAVDAGYGQLDKKLIEDKRVHNIEKFNARFLEKDTFNIEFDVAVMDVSFISQTLLHNNIYSVLNENGLFISLIKPQFECGKSNLSKNGIVKDKKARENAVLKSVQSAIECGFSLIGLVKSKIEGGDGNIEYLAVFSKQKINVDYVEIIKKLFKEEK